ncbi:hypothetical protein [Streptomyces asiaticus]|uniref:hypothetical protein n=1 Tax=Streptomyces asiaticus TaxID=114695 RepID=UPI003F669D59
MNRSTTLPPPPATATDVELAGYRAEMVTRYLNARGDEFAELAILAEAVRFDKQHPDAVPLYDELHGTTLGLAA